MQTVFNLMIYLAGFGITDLIMKENKVTMELKVIIYMILGLIGYHNYKKYITNNIDGKTKK
jgi:hypothetical protein